MKGKLGVIILVIALLAGISSCTSSCDGDDSGGSALAAGFAIPAIIDADQTPHRKFGGEFLRPFSKKCQLLTKNADNAII